MDRKHVFLSHATTDKEAYVRPFAHELDRRGISYWLDEAEIAWGDKIAIKINEGLKLSDFVVVFLSDAFVGRPWTETELGNALNRENSEGRVVVLPVIVGAANGLLEQYPVLKDKAHIHWDVGVAAIADELQALKQRRWSLAELDQFIIDRVDLEQFPKKDIWGPRYRLLTSQMHGDEGAYFFWDEEAQCVERYWIDAVRSHGTESLTADDVELVRSVVVQHQRDSS